MRATNYVTPPATHLQLTSFALNLISTAASALETGHLALASFAISMKAAAARLGTCASVFSSIRVMVGPSPRLTAAVVWMRVYSMLAKAIDRAGNIGTATLYFNIKVPPT